MKSGDLVKIDWPDGETAVGFFVRFERGFAVFKQATDGEQFVALVRESTKMNVIKNA